MTKYKHLGRAVAAGAALLASVPALAQTAPANTYDYSTLTDNVSVGETITAVLSVAAILMVLSVTILGVRKIFKIVNNGS